MKALILLVGTLLAASAMAESNKTNTSPNNSVLQNLERMPELTEIRNKLASPSLRSFLMKMAGTLEKSKPFTIFVPNNEVCSESSCFRHCVL